MVVETIHNILLLVIEIDGTTYIVNENVSTKVDNFSDDLVYTYPDLYKGVLTIRRVYRPFYNDSSFEEKFLFKYIVWDREDIEKREIREEIARLQKKLDE